MCARITLTTTAQRLAQQFDLFDVPAIAPRYNIAPTQPVAIVRMGHHQRRELARVAWGLVPSWAKDVSISSRLINARSETVQEKPAFRHAFRRRRCIVPADGFYEWKSDHGSKRPHLIRSASSQTLALAGLWESWHSTEGSEIETCTILTTAANLFMRPLHDRMPVILSMSDVQRWLVTDETLAHELEPLMKPCPEDWLSMTEVGRFVSNPARDEPRCIEPVTPSPQTGLLFGLE
jgi:putative SOS response-associated peptidase YedK